MSLLTKRPRRNRKSSSIRSLVQENHVLVTDLVAPYFVIEGHSIRYPLASLPGSFHLSVDQMLKEAEEISKIGITSMILFPVISPAHKDALASTATGDNNPLFEAIRQIKQSFPQLTLIADVALDPFTNHGHDGLVSDKNTILNDETLEVLAKMAIFYSEAGVDIIAPSDMMDGRVGYIRERLDEEGFYEVSIMSYTAKYASSLYNPFREVLQSSLKFGDKKSYQMNPADARAALLEASLDEQEGADMLMIKPATLYLDIIHRIRKQTNLPIAAYHVSGEYAMLKAAAQKGWLNFNETLYESLIGIKRAGADILITYGAREMAAMLHESKSL